MDVEPIDDAADARWRRAPAMGRLQPWIEWFGIGRLVGAALAAVLVVVGGWWLLRAPPPPIEAGLPRAGVTTTVAGAGAPTATAGPSTSTTEPAVIVVHVAGAVTAPGVYALEPGARVVDAVAAAGGTLVDADPAALNLAAPVRDGERIYVVRRGETPPPAPPAGPVAGPEGSTAPAGPIDLNRATAVELDELPGVGPATAAAIVAHRDEHGPFASVDDLEAVPGIGPAKLAALRDLVTT